MKRKQYLVKNTALFALNSIGTKLITFFLVPVYTKSLSTADYGIADLVSTIAMILVPILTLNIGEAVMRFCLDEAADYNKNMSVGLVVMFMSILEGILIIPVCGMIPAVAQYKIYISLYCISHGIYQISVCYLRGTEKLTQYAMSNIVHVFSTASLNIIFLLFFKMGLYGYFNSYILGYLIGTVFALAAGRVWDVIRNFSFDWALAKKMSAYSIVLVPTSFMWWIMNSSDRLMVSAMVGVAANGIYAISYKVPTVLSTMSTVFNQAWSYSAIKEDKSNDRERFNNIMFHMFISFQTLVTCGLLMVIKPFISVYVNDNYYSAWKYTPYLLIGYFFMSIGTFLSTSYTVNKDSKGFLKSGMSGAVMNIILNWLLIPIIGVSGAALATCLSYVTVFVYRAFDTRKYIFIDLFKTNYIVSLIMMIIMGITVYVDNMYGQYLLVLEFLIIMILKKDFIEKALSIVKNVISSLIKKVKK